ncbi:hypothetical protein DRN74_02540 [Candidatus Micrarchaeota archaeon]|nr:MAG: hypothetical protein DRN74_02540 [Candidatus Micrarchaeota archaeon]
MKRAQGSLEYLVLITVVLGISAVVIMFTLGAFGTQKTAGDLNKCKAAASQCLSQLLTGASDCPFCEDACIDAQGRDIQSHEAGCGVACQLCKEGKVNMIGVGVESGGQVTPQCGNSICEATENCENCPQDCGCPPGQVCQNGQCVEEVHKAICGNGVAEEGEDCDGEDLNGQSCQSLGYDKGTLRCDANCHFDSSECKYNKVPIVDFSHLCMKIGSDASYTCYFVASVRDDEDISDWSDEQFLWNIETESGGIGVIGKEVEQTYASLGTYDVSLTVTDNFGASNSTSKAVDLCRALTLKTQCEQEENCEWYTPQLGMAYCRTKTGID